MAVKSKRDSNMFLAIVFLFSFILMMSNDIYKGSLTLEDFLRSILIGLFSVAAAIGILSLKDKFIK